MEETHRSTDSSYFEPQQLLFENESASGLAEAPSANPENHAFLQHTRADLNAPFRPKHIIPASSLRVGWSGVIVNSAWSGPPGIGYYADDKGTQLLEFRDDDGLLRGVFVLYGPRCDYELPGQALLLVDPEVRRRGVATALLQDAFRRGFEINWHQQSYTRSGWAVVRKFLHRQRSRTA